MKQRRFFPKLLALTAMSFLFCAIRICPAAGEVKFTKSDKSESKTVETGIASYYADKYHGKLTASGEAFDMHALTAAHPILKFGTRVKVTHLGNQRSVVVRINDRGPFVKNRVIDLSLAAAKELQMVTSGLAEVRLEVIP